MRKLLPICFLLLTACRSTIPSESIANGVIKDLNAHQQAIATLDKQTTKECKTDAFVASLNALKSQTESIAGQVKSISQACTTEKNEIKNKLEARNCIIIILCIIIGLFVWLRIKK